MSRACSPNQGPYIVSYVSYENWRGLEQEIECQTWAYACQVMRELLLEGCDNISVRFV